MKNLKIVIQHENGDYWTGEAFGPECARRVYTDVNDLPRYLEDHNGAELLKEEWCDNIENLHVQWYLEDEDGGAVAGAHVIC